MNSTTYTLLWSLSYHSPTTSNKIFKLYMYIYIYTCILVYIHVHMRTKRRMAVYPCKIRAISRFLPADPSLTTQSSLISNYFNLSQSRDSRPHTAGEILTFRSRTSLYQLLGLTSTPAAVSTPVATQDFVH